jgi:2-haloacid dehalogenase
MKPIAGAAEIAACVFDAYGTLLDFASAVARERPALGARADSLNELWRRKQLEYSWLRALMRHHLNFRDVTRQALDWCFEALGIDDPALADRLMRAYDELDPYPEVPDTLARLRDAGLQLAILSNGTPEMLEAATASAGIRDRLDALFSIEEVGIFKPAPEVYAVATRGLGLPARRIAFLSSNAWDAHGAAAFGFRTIWVNRGGAPRERLPGELAGEIRDLSVLPALLGRDG